MLNSANQYSKTKIGFGLCSLGKPEWSPCVYITIKMHLRGNIKKENKSKWKQSKGHIKAKSILQNTKF